MGKDIKHYHLCSDGEVASDLILDDGDMYAAFNRFGICQAAVPDATVISFTVEDTHVHALLKGSQPDCVEFREKYERSTRQHIINTRGSMSGVVLAFQLLQITDEDYLKNVAAYTVIQATKDGKKVMPYDYKWGTGALYFRSGEAVLPWHVGNEKPRRISELTVRERRSLLKSRQEVPGDWLVCNGFLLPENYIDIEAFQQIYQTHNAFRVFQSSSKSKTQEFQARMELAKGVMLEYSEARSICSDMSKSMFGTRNIHSLHSYQKIKLAQALWRQNGMSPKQISAIVYLPEDTILKVL